MIMFKGAFLTSGTWNSIIKTGFSLLLGSIKLSLPWIKTVPSYSSPASPCSSKKEKENDLSHSKNLSRLQLWIPKKGDHFSKSSRGDAASDVASWVKVTPYTVFWVSMGEVVEDFYRKIQSWGSLQTGILWHKSWSSYFLGTLPPWLWSHLI